MRIGILTFHAPCNFGANLQAFTSFMYFSSFGHDVQIINYHRKIDSDYKNTIDSIQFCAHQTFVEKNIPTTRLVTNFVQLTEVVKECRFDLIVVGADAVWRVMPVDDMYVFFMKWLFDSPEINTIPVVSISAAHMGNGFSALEQSTRDNLRDCLDQFKYISVRDSWTKRMINKDLYGFKRIKTMNPDPVFLLDTYVDNKIWNPLNSGLGSKAYFLLTLPEDWLSTHRKKKLKWFNRFTEIVHKGGYRLVELPIPEGVSGLPFDYTIPYPVDSLQWFLWIKNAKAFCGLRYHAIISCISTGTPFFSLDTYGNASFLVRALNSFGFYRLGRLFDYRSKIRNLLVDSDFKRFRISGNIQNISPDKLFKMLEKVHIEAIIAFRNKNIKMFEYNFNEMFKEIDKHEYKSKNIIH